VISLDKIKAFWEKLPAEIKVALYITVSYTLAELIVILGKLEINSVPLSFAINILLVFLKNLKPRIDSFKEIEK
jgi:hypothetical protein